MKFKIPILMTVMEELKNNIGIYPSKIAKNTGVTYGHVLDILKLLEDKKIVVRQKKGRTIHYKPCLDSVDLFQANSQCISFMKKHRLEE